MSGWFRHHLETVLLGQPAQGNRQVLGHALVAVFWGAAVYGTAMGSYGGLASDRVVQVVYSGIKAPLLLAATTALALPSFFVLNSFAGLRNDFALALRAVIGVQGVVGVVLASLTPYTILWYASSSGHNAAILFNGLVFLTASTAAQWVLRRRYADLIARNPRHRTMMRVWMVVYCFIGVQMGWVLRPFVGDPGLPPSFFREGAWGNAYVVVAAALWRAIVP